MYKKYLQMVTPFTPGHTVHTCGEWEPRTYLYGWKGLDEHIPRLQTAHPYPRGLREIWGLEGQMFGLREFWSPGQSCYPSLSTQSSTKDIYNHHMYNHDMYNKRHHLGYCHLQGRLLDHSLGVPSKEAVHIPLELPDDQSPGSHPHLLPRSARAEHGPAAPCRPCGAAATPR